MSRVVRVVPAAPGVYTLYLSCNHSTTVQAKIKPSRLVEVCRICRDAWLRDHGGAP